MPEEKIPFIIILSEKSFRIIPTLFNLLQQYLKRNRKNHRIRLPQPPQKSPVFKIFAPENGQTRLRLSRTSGEKNRHAAEQSAHIPPKASKRHAVK